MFTKEPVLGVTPRADIWAVMEPAVWSAPDLHVTLPRGFLTDLASIPMIIRNLLDVNGVARCPALLHDWLYTTGCVSKTAADEQFRRALILYGMSRALARTYWLGVHWFGAHAWSAHRKAGITAQDFDTTADYVAWDIRGRSA